ncbi:MAG TPA: hypothetical protein VGF94_26770 [Kofleriaceae bacterium]|jgi:DNA repair exonuclease SbcCD ATPase subunit
MRCAAGILVLLCLCSCKTKGGGDADASPDPAAQEAVLARRDALLKARTQLQSTSAQLAKKIDEAKAQGSDTSDLEKQKAEIDSKLDSTTADALALLSSQTAALKQTGDKLGSLAAREAALDAREKSLNERSDALTQKAITLAQLDSELAKRWKDSCAMSSAPLIIQAAPTKGGTYSKSDVSALVAKAKSGMAKKGLITTDLPGPAQALESETSKALNDNDTSKAYFAAAQLAATVDSIQVNREFIRQKIARLQAQLKSSKVDESTQHELASILGDVMDKYSAGDFIAANRRLDQLAQQLNK